MGGIPSLDTKYAPTPAAQQYGGPFQTWTLRDVWQVVENTANKLGLDPRLAVAQMLQESGGNPYAIGDSGTSFGIFQLHRGGELGNLSPAQAFNPSVNAGVSLAVDAQVAKAHPDWSPGRIAAAAQRPADPAGYARSVDAIYQALGGGYFESVATQGNHAVTGDNAQASADQGYDPRESASSSKASAKILVSLDEILNVDPGITSLLNPIKDVKVLLARGAVVLVGLILGSAGLYILTGQIIGPKQVQEVANAAALGAV